MGKHIRPTASTQLAGQLNKNILIKISFTTIKCYKRKLSLIYTGVVAFAALSLFHTERAVIDITNQLQLFPSGVVLTRRILLTETL